MPNISISGTNQPVTRLSVKRPPPMWSMAAACLAANSGCTVGMCEVANTLEYEVVSDRPAAQANTSNPSPLKLVSPPNPFQRPTGTMASNFISSARRASSLRRRPLGFEQACHFRNRAAAGEIGGERAEFERGIVEERIRRGRSRRLLTGHRHALSGFRRAGQTRRERRVRASLLLPGGERSRAQASG